MRAQILSTKALSASQKQLFSNSEAALTDYDAIAVHFTYFKPKKKVKNAIFSSQNAIKSMKKYQNELFLGQIENCFCVGLKTASLLEESGQNVLKIAVNASELGNFIQNNFKNEDFYFFCGSNRRDDLPNTFKKSENRLIEIKTYDIESKIEEFNQNWGKIMFFSPSGVQSFTKKNNIGSAVSICIGQTTASEAKKYTDLVIVSNESTVESVIKKACQE